MKRNGLFAGMAVLCAISPVLAQNLLVNGSFDDPALARLTIGSGGVADGDTIEIDISGTNRVYEFDTNNSVASGRVRVDVSSGTGADNAANRFRTAINADALAPCTASGSGSSATLTWKGAGGVNADNANTVDSKGTINITNFADPASCPDSNGVAVLGWTGLNRRNGDLYVPTCTDGAHASVQGWGFNVIQIYQTVSVSPGMSYTLSGRWWIGHMGTIGNTTATAEMRNGASASDALIAQATAVRAGDGDSGAWLNFSVNGVAVGTQMTIVLKVNNTGPTGFAMHVDACVLAPTTCVNPPQVAAISPAYASRGEVLNNVTITGENFTAGKTNVKLSYGTLPDIVATNVNVTSSTSLTCTLNLAGATAGLRDLIVSVGDTAPSQLNCSPATLVGAFRIVLPAFSNGSFESPDAPGACPVTPIPGAPTDWQLIESAGYGYVQGLFRDGTLFTPTCPPRDGLHYASSTSTNDGGAGAEATIYQTIAVTPNTGYSFSGDFAGGGNNAVKLELRDGDVNAAALASTTIYQASGHYDWTYASVFGQPSTNIMTLVWYIDLNGAGPHASHADNLSLEVCNTPVDVIGIQPKMAFGDGVVTISNLAGAGFQVGGNPIVQLIKGNTRITATDVMVLSPNQITCKFNLTGAGSGPYTVFVKQGGCSGILASSDPEAFRVVAAEFVNGDFEGPEAPQNCGPPPAIVGGMPTGWNSDANLVRDGNAPMPPSCPSPDGGHYATLSSDQAGFLRAWQTIRVLPGQSYTFSGRFAGPSDARLQLLDGFEDGNVIAQSQVVVQGDGGAWREASVAGAALSNVMTLVWQVEPTSGNPGGHADALKFASNCHAIWADADDDGDVDMDDFADWQRCLSINGVGPNDPPYCRCFDRVAPFGQVDEADFPSFSHCVSGPNVPWTGCNP